MSNEKRKPRRKAQTPEAREKQLIALAYDRAEERLLDGSATSQEICHFLKMGSIERQYELEKLRNENELLKAKTESIASQKKADELYAEAMKAFGTYRGFSDDSSEEDSDG